MEKYFLGTYTKRNLSHGIYTFDLDPDHQVASNLKLFAEAGDPFYLTNGPDNLLYSIDYNRYADKPGGIKALSKEFESPTVKYSVYDATASGTYIDYDAENQLVFTANYDINEISIYSTRNNKFTLLDRTHDVGQLGPEPEQADGPHPHFINYTPDHRLVVCDLGIDTILTYNITNDYKFELVATLKMPAGFGPRHLRFNHDQNIAYAVGELSSDLATLKYDPKLGQFSIVDIISTIPANWHTHNGAAAIRISADNRFVYVSNRGYNSVVVYKIAANGSVEQIQNVHTDGDFPWDIQFSKSEQSLLVANQRSNSLSVFQRNTENGKLKLLNSDFMIPEPLAILRTE